MPPGRDSFRRNRVAPTTPSFYHPAMLSVHQGSQPILSQWRDPEQGVYTPRSSRSSNHPNPSDLTLHSTPLFGSSPPKPMGPQDSMKCSPGTWPFLTGGHRTRTPT